jgi:hypothetical protein
MISRDGHWDCSAEVDKSDGEVTSAYCVQNMVGYTRSSDLAMRAAAAAPVERMYAVLISFAHHMLVHICLLTNNVIPLVIPGVDMRFPCCHTALAGNISTNNTYQMKHVTRQQAVKPYIAAAAAALSCSRRWTCHRCLQRLQA